jgi:hypothetical protein
MVMNSNDQWIVGEFNKVNDRITKLEVSIKGVTVRMGIYTAIATFCSTGLMAVIVKSIT